MNLHVSSLWRYPLKSVMGVSLPVMKVNSWGPDLDRRWMVVDSQRRFLSQRQLPMMCRLAASLTESGLRLQSLDDQSLFTEVTEPSDAERYLVTVWSDTAEAIDAGDVAAGWLTDLLGRELRLCFMPDTTHRQVDAQFALAGRRVSFADGFPFLLCSEFSLLALSDALRRSLDMRRFRPNIVVSGAAPFAEDTWQRIRIANIEFDVVKPCARCVIPTINLDSAAREADVFEMLRAERGSNGEVYFGQNLVHYGEGEIAVGQSVEILE
jgi:uncharacterized protein YcbX